VLSNLKNTIVYLLGYAGTGKYTIAKELCRTAPEFHLVDNHLINNPLFSLIHADGITPLPPRIWDNVGKVWDAVIDTMIHISPPDYSFVLTNALSDSAKDVAWFHEVEDMASRRNATFVPVVLKISLDEHKKRIVSPDRVDRMKEIDPNGPARYAAADNLIRPIHPNLLTLDVSSISAEQSAQSILNHIKTI
jgi:hypothetical protein